MLNDDVQFSWKTIILEVIAFQSVQLNDKYYALRVACRVLITVT